MLAELRPALIITRREVRDQLRDWRIITPIVALTIFFPGLMNFTAAQAINFVQRYGAELVGERLIPFLLMVVGFFPISISLVIALESFVGEKERLSIEPLLSTPLYDWQLYLGKLLASMAPPLIAAYLGIFVYLFGVYRQVGYTPEPALLIQILLLTTVQAVVMVSGAVVISTQTTSTRAANLLASFIIIPVALLVQGESMIMFWGQYSALWWVIIGLALIAVLLIRMGITHFNREELLGRQLDSLNFRWIGATFISGLKGESRSFKHWLVDFYRNTFSELAWPVLVVSLALLLAYFTGSSLSTTFPIPLERINLEAVKDGQIEGLEELAFLSAGGVFTLWYHNLRALALATLLGIASFGVLGVLVVMLPLGIIGYFSATLAAIGISPFSFLAAFVLPHGILEIPAMIIAGASILRIGATLAGPARKGTIGSAFIYAVADWVKVFVLIVAPLLLGAALLEVYLTPEIVLWFFAQ